MVVFCKQLENKARRVMEVMECEILPDGTRNFRPLFQYHITENRMENGKIIITGHHGIVQGISQGLQRRLLENGMPQSSLKHIMEMGGAL